MSKIRYIWINEDKTEAEILALTSQMEGLLFVASDTWITYEINNLWTPEVSKKHIIYITKEGNTWVSKSILETSSNWNIHRINATKSLLNGEEMWWMQGKHFYSISSNITTVDLLGSTTPATIVAGSNAEFVNGYWEKNIAGNAWNSYIYSQESFNPLEEDFAVTIEVEDDPDGDGESGLQGTVREMFGFDDNPTQNQSYTSWENFVYQVNNYFYSRVYEKWVATLMDWYSTFYFQVWDKVWVKCIDGYVTYFVLRWGVETEIFASNKRAIAPLFFKASFNRWVWSTGHSRMWNIEWYRSDKQKNTTIQIQGESTEIISDSDKWLCESIWIEIQAGATYSDIKYIRKSGEKYEDGVNPYNTEVTHWYVGSYAQSSETIIY